MLDWSLLLIPGAALGRAVFGWLENSLEDHQITLPEWQQLGATVVRMGVPMVALVAGLNVNPAVAAGAITLFDIVIVKIYNAVKK